MHQYDEIYDGPEPEHCDVGVSEPVEKGIAQAALEMMEIMA